MSFDDLPFDSFPHLFLESLLDKIAMLRMLLHLNSIDMAPC